MTHFPLNNSLPGLLFTDEEPQHTPPASPLLTPSPAKGVLEEIPPINLTQLAQAVNHLANEALGSFLSPAHLTSRRTILRPCLLSNNSTRQV